jgi:hypothetical protein
VLHDNLSIHSFSDGIEPPSFVVSHPELKVADAASPFGEIVMRLVGVQNLERNSRHATYIWGHMRFGVVFLSGSVALDMRRRCLLNFTPRSRVNISNPSRQTTHWEA